MEDLLMSRNVRRVMHVSSNNLPVLTTQFDNPRGDLPFWKNWLQQTKGQPVSQTFMIAFCTAEHGKSHKCESPCQSEYFVPGLDLPSKFEHLLESIQLEVTSSDITADSLDQPQVLTMRGTVRVRLTDPGLEVSAWRESKLNIQSGCIRFV